MQPSFWHYCKVVAAVHVIGILIVFCGGWIKQCFREKPEVILPIEFVVDTTTPAAAVVTAQPVETRRPEPPPPDETVIPEKIVKPKPTRRKIEVSKERVTRRVGDPPPDKPRLTQEEIAKLLAMGAKPSDHTSVPDEDQRCLARIRDTLHAAWVEPSAEAVGGQEALLLIRFGSDGRIAGGELRRASGSAELDASVRQILSTVHEVPGLTPAFLKRYPSVTIAFTVKQ